MTFSIKPLIIPLSTTKGNHDMKSIHITAILTENYELTLKVNGKQFCESKVMSDIYELMSTMHDAVLEIVNAPIEKVIPVVYGLAMNLYTNRELKASISL